MHDFLILNETNKVGLTKLIYCKYTDCSEIRVRECKFFYFLIHTPYQKRYLITPRREVMRYAYMYYTVFYSLNNAYAHQMIGACP